MKRVLIVFDGKAWFVRGVRAIEHDLSRDEKVYHCDVHLGGPFKTAKKALDVLKEKSSKKGWRFVSLKGEPT